jgi:hypothetical protein
MIISRWILLIMRNVSDKSCWENQNTHFMFSKFFSRKSNRIWDNVEIYGGARQATDNSIIQHRKHARIHTQPRNIYYLLFFHRNSGYANVRQLTVLLLLNYFCVGQPCNMPPRETLQMQGDQLRRQKQNSIQTPVCCSQMVRVAENDRSVGFCCIRRACEVNGIDIINNYSTAHLACVPTALRLNRKCVFLI